MQKDIQKIIAVLNDFSMADEVLGKTYAFAQKYNTSVQILYVHETPLFEIPDYFRSETEKSNIDKEKIKNTIKKKIETFTKNRPTALFVQINDTENRIWALAKDDKKSLIITAYHQEITKRLWHNISQPLLIVKTQTQTYHKIAMMVDTETQIDTCITKLKNYFPNNQTTLLFDHRYIPALGIETEIQSAQILEKVQRESFEEIKKQTALEGAFFIDGYLSDLSIDAYIQQNNFELLYVCSHRESLSPNLLETCRCDLYASG